MKKDLLLLCIFIYGILGNIIYNIILIHRDWSLDYLITEYFIPCGIGIIVSISAIISIIKNFYRQIKWDRFDYRYKKTLDLMDKPIPQKTEVGRSHSKVTNILIVFAKLIAILVILGDIFYYILMTLIAALIGDWARNGIQYHCLYTFPNLAVIISLIYSIRYIMHKKEFRQHN